MLASEKGYLDIVQALLAKGADVNATDNDGDTALMRASVWGRLEVVQALLAKDAKVNAKTNVGWIAPMLASKEGHLNVVQALLARGPTSKEAAGIVASDCQELRL